MSSGYRFGYGQRVAGFDAVFVGSGINALAGAALLSKAGWSVCVLEREAELGGCIRTSTDLTVPGFTHEVLASWHPLFTGSPAYAELKADLDRAWPRVPEHRAPDRRGVPGRLRSVPHDLARGQRRRARAARRRPTARRWESMFNAFMTNADLSFGVLGTELWSPAGLGLGRQALRRFGRRGLLEYVGGVLASCRDWLDDTFEAGRSARPPRAVGAPHGARARSGDLGLHDAGDRLRAPARRDARPEGRRHRVLVDGLAGHRPRRRRRGSHAASRSSACSSRAGVPPRSGWPAARRSAPSARSSPESRRLSSTGSCSERETSRRRSRARPSAFATAAARCRSTSR